MKRSMRDEPITGEEYDQARCDAAIARQDCERNTARGMREAFAALAVDHAFLISERDALLDLIRKGLPVLKTGASVIVDKKRRRFADDLVLSFQEVLK